MFKPLIRYEIMIVVSLLLLSLSLSKHSDVIYSGLFLVPRHGVIRFWQRKSCLIQAPYMFKSSTTLDLNSCVLGIPL